MRGAALLLLLALATPSVALAQWRGGGGSDSAAPRALLIGARLGFDFHNDAPVLGAVLRAGSLGPLSFQAGAEAVFLDGLIERQFGGEVLYALGRALRVGAGPTWRNTVFEPADHPDVRDTRLGYAIVALLGGTPGPGRTVTGIEFRYSSVSDLGQRTVSIHFSLPVLGR